MNSSNKMDAHRLDFQAISRVMLEMHRTGRESAFSSFQEQALDLIRELIPFDSAWWGNAAAEPMEIHSLRLFNCAPSILKTYTPYMDQDFFRAALMAHPGVSANMSDLTTRANYVRTELYRAVGKPYRIEWSLGTLLVEPVSSLQEFLTLWRHDARKPFSETERQTKQLLMPHIAQAHSDARLREMLQGEQTHEASWAVSDERGFLRQASPAFIHCLCKQWPLWQGSRLPEPLLVHVRLGTSFNASQLKLEIAPKGAFRLLQVRPHGALDTLSTREREIVMLYGRGETYARIAQVLGLSPSTVRNNIAHCYRKLSVNNKAELAARLQARN
ncbi:MAG: helix-turn-helix transcriptional regulator [Burkholderiaceae bacterium]